MTALQKLVNELRAVGMEGDAPVSGTAVCDIVSSMYKELKVEAAKKAEPVLKHIVIVNDGHIHEIRGTSGTAGVELIVMRHDQLIDSVRVNHPVALPWRELPYGETKWIQKNT